MCCNHRPLAPRSASLVVGVAQDIYLRSLPFSALPPSSSDQGTPQQPSVDTVIVQFSQKTVANGPHVGPRGSEPRISLAGPSAKLLVQISRSQMSSSSIAILLRGIGSLWELGTTYRCWFIGFDMSSYL